ncbi:MAG TPA: dephospho-CoA kinase [Candidatus Humimicrobiaceae bacterium]
MEIFILKEEFKIIIGITGKTGCGKSFTAGYLKENLSKSIVLDVDLLAKEIYRDNHDVVKKAAVSFGKEILKTDGSIDFPKLGRIVFEDNSQMKKLNDLMFPLIAEEVTYFIKNHPDKSYIIIDAAILFDAGLDRFCDKIVYVTAHNVKREKFLKCRDSDIYIKDIRQRIFNQKINVNMNKIDFVIENDSSVEALYENIDSVITKL